MRQIYAPGTANYPRLATDRFFVDYANRFAFRGHLDAAIRFVERAQLLRGDLWARFVEQYRMGGADNDGGWRGEYWGKMMRGACFTYSYTQNPALYDALTATVRDMLSTADAEGRISSFDRDHEFRGWDLWSRKYVLLGMQYFLEICRDEDLRAQIIVSMTAQVDYLLPRLGPKSEGKKPIVEATNNWRGLNSASILEPVVRLYSLTGEQRFLDFAAYIVSTGGTSVANLFTLAYEDNFAPYQYPVTKAYEMISCFEGLLEYYRVTGKEKDKAAVIRFADKLLATDFTVIGSSGCTHELFDHSTVRQANPAIDEVAQETCVTVTVMKFLYQLTLLTGDPRYVDAFETSLYNAYLGALNTEGVIEPTLPQKHPDCHYEPLPFDSYSPLTSGTRGKRIGGFQIMADRHYYGCCACIGSAGVGLIGKMALLSTEAGFAYNLFTAGEITSTTPAGQAITFAAATDYPVSGEVTLTLHLASPERFTLLVRNPAWSKATSVALCGKPVPATAGYIVLTREWADGDTVSLALDMRTEAIYPIPYGHDILMNNTVWAQHYMTPTYDIEHPLTAHHIALRRGPLMLAQENRLGYSVDDPIEVAVGADGYVDVAIPNEPVAPYPNLLEVTVPLTDGGAMHVTDYASAGKSWNETARMAVWMLTK